jgi:hypothetical protein
VAGWLLTQLFVLAAWTFFRAHTLGGAVVMLQGMTGQGPESRLQTLRDSAFVAGSAVALLTLSLTGRRGWRLPVPAPNRRLRPVLMGAAASVLIVVGSALLPATGEPFIYFQF